MAVRQTISEHDPYFALIRRFPLRRLTSDSELGEAIAIIDELTSRSDLTQGERDYLDVLSDLVHHYETTEHPIPPATDSEILRYLMEAHDLNQVQLSDKTGITVSTLSEVLSGKRGLSKGNIGTLSRFFHVSPAVFNFG